MRLTERFDVEHRLFLYQLDDLAELIRARVDPQAWHAAARTLGHVLSLHMSLEERLLFPALVETRPRSARLLAELEDEHRAIQQLAQAMRADESGCTAFDFIEALRRHVEKETYVAFPIVEEALADGLPALTRVGAEAGLPSPRHARRGDWPECWLG